jgi:pyridoxine kinase
MGVISVQSQVSFGHVGNSAAQFAMQWLGVEVWPVHTALLAHHPGEGGFHGAKTDPDTVCAIFDGLRRAGTFPECQALLSGYLGSIEVGRAMLAARREIKVAAPDALYCCAAVMGDREEGLYVDAALPDFFRDAAVPAADIVIANAFEAEVLTGVGAGVGAGGLAGAQAAGTALRRMGPAMAIVSSVPLGADGTDGIGTLLTTDNGAWLARTPRLQVPAKGAGDLMGAVWLAGYLRDGDAATALQLAVGATRVALEASASRPRGELDLVGTASHWRDAGRDTNLETIVADARYC